MLQGIKMTLAPVAWKFLCGTLKLEPLPQRFLEDQQPYIFSSLHRDILPGIMHIKFAQPALLVSKSPDGDILTRTLGDKHYSYVRGATGEDGGKAFVHLVRALEQGTSVAVALDGPKGPYGVIHEGALQLARLTGVPILPFVARPSRAKVLATWDRTVVPLPGSRVSFVHGEVLRISRHGGKEELAQAKQKLFKFFQETEALT